MDVKISKKNTKFSHDEDQLMEVDGDIDVMQFLRNVIETESQNEAFFVFDVQDVIYKYKNWKEKLPRIFPHYAVKCNNHPHVMKILSSLGIGFDCASKEEIKIVLSWGVDPSRIIFANSKKPLSYIKYAANQGIELYTFDNESELYKFKKVYPSAKLILRFKCDDFVSDRVMGSKFGCDAVAEAPALMNLAHSLKLNIVGVSFHIGTNCLSPGAFKKAIFIAHNLFKLGDSIGFHMHILDIGGGFPGSRRSTFDAVASVINKSLDDYFPIDSNVSIIAEPGRYFTQSAFTLATQIHSKRVISDPVTALYRNVYYINDGVYGTFFLKVYNLDLYTPTLLSDGRFRERRSSSILGASNNPLDVIKENIILPDLDVGEWIIFKNMGAYTMSAPRPSNLFPKPKLFSILNKSSIISMLPTLGMIFDEDC